MNVASDNSDPHWIVYSNAEAENNALASEYFFAFSLSLRINALGGNHAQRMKSAEAEYLVWENDGPKREGIWKGRLRASHRKQIPTRGEASHINTRPP